MAEKNGEQLNNEQEDSFERKKTKFFYKIIVQVREALKIHKEAGLLDWDEELDRSWRDVSEHCLVEAARAEVFADKLGLSDDVKKDLIISAALHDFLKKEEIKIYDTEGMTWSNYEKAEEKASELLEKKGFNRHIIELVNSIGLIALSEIGSILKRESLSEEDIAFLVLHYVDDYTSGSDWVNASEIGEGGKRVNDLDRRLNSAALRYKPLIEDGRSRFNGESPINVEIRTGHLIEKRIAGFLNAKDNGDIIPEDLPYLIDQEIRNKIESQ